MDVVPACLAQKSLTLETFAFLHSCLTGLLLSRVREDLGFVVVGLRA